MNIDLNIPSIGTEGINVVDYPSAGTSETIGCNTANAISLTNIIALDANTSSSSAGTASFLRANSFSVCKLPDNTALVAVAAQDTGVELLPPTNDEGELARRFSSRVHLISAPMNNYASCVRRAVIVSIDAEATGDCKTGLIDISIDVGDDVWDDTNLDSIWVLDGDFQNVKFKIVKRIAPNVWRILPADKSVIVDLDIARCFRFIAYSTTKTYKYPNSLNSVNPLPYIQVDGVAVPAINPQIATNACAAPNSSPFVYIIAEAPVNGTHQLFFYGIQFGSQVGMFGWRQLTFDGENRNAKIKCDNAGNLHITWESSRCKPSQVFYGVLGPTSRAIANETFAAAVDKQIQTGSASSIQSLVTISSPTAVDLRDVDEYGTTIQPSAWTELEANGGSATITNETTVSVTGNPRTQKFAGFASLKRDQDDVYFDGKFSQLSYQISFGLALNASTESFTDDDIAEEWLSWKQGFSPAPSGNNANVYLKTGKYYTLSEPQTVYENIIPIVGAYENNNAAQLALKDFMLVAVPEKVRFIASSTQGLSDDRTEYYTGRFKLGLVFETSANVSDQTLSYQKHHWIRLFGDPISFNTTNQYKVAVHYSHLRDEAVAERAGNNTLEAPLQDVRFSGDIIVAVGSKVVVAETFIPDFSKQYHQFDLGFGCASVGEFRTLSLNPYDGSVNDNLSVTMNFTTITVGPHSIKANEYLTSFAKTDRNVSKMVVYSEADELESMTSPEEAWDSSLVYWLSLGLNRQKFGLSQVPITNVGKNVNPAIDLDRCGRPHIAYQSNRDKNWEIYYASGIEVGMPFRFDTKITDSESNSLNPTISVDNDGRRLIAWHDDRTGVYQIFAARSTSPINCNDGICTRDQLAYLGLNPITSGFQITTEYDPYIEDPYFGNVCSLSFIFKNESATSKKFHFRANFYTDSNFTSFHDDVDSRLNISNWLVNGQQMPFDGYQIAAGQSVEVTYNVSDEDGFIGDLYYVEFEADEGTKITPLEVTSIFFCPTRQNPRCVIPIVYTNQTGVDQTGVDFRVTVYRDESLTQAVLAATSSSNVIRWVSGSNAFPIGGVDVKSNDMVSVVYNPEFVDLDQTDGRDSQINTLLCGVKYWVVAEANDTTGWHIVDTFALQCVCKDIKTQIWRKDTQSLGWHCSGQGGQDIRITATSSHALFPDSGASEDGVVYIAWEDRRFAETKDSNNHYIYYGIWDARKDTFFCSAQGFRDREVSAFSRYRPAVLVNNMQHAVFFFSEGNSIHSRICSLYQEKVSSSSSSVSTTQGQQGVFNQKTLNLTSQDAENCLIAKVYHEDEVELYHKDGQNPISLVDQCKVRLEIVGPPGSYGVRFRNENETGWSEWLNVLPKLPNYPSSSSGALRGSLDGYFVGTDRFVVPWVLSRGSGSKTVTCQVLTYSGVSPEFSLDLVARYQDLKHKIEFFRDASHSKPASLFKGTPVVSTKALTIDDSDATTIEDTATTNSTIYVKITFEEPQRLANLIEISSLAKYGGVADLTFDVYTQGFNKFNLPLTSASSGVYTGNFSIDKHDGIDNKDGEAVVVVNIPTPCAMGRSSSSAVCFSNLIKPSDISIQRLNDVNAMNVDLETFRLQYNQEVTCQFTSNQCVDGSETITEGVNDIDDETPHVGGTFNCTKINWTSPRVGEKSYYLPNGGVNAADWTVVSPVFELDFTDDRIDYLKFDTSNTVLDDILFMVRPNDTITASVAPSGSSSSSTGGPAALNVTFNIPQGAVLFAANNGYYCHAPSYCNNGSAAKIFKVNATTIGTVPAGTLANNGTGTMYTTFTASPLLPTAMGYNYGSLTSSSTGHITNVVKTTFNVSVSRHELAARGFITVNGKLRFKLVHIPSGVGEAKIVGITCGAACDLFSSSSSSA